MRALGAIAGLAFGLAGITAACAADFPLERGAIRTPVMGYTHHAVMGRRAAALPIYDYRPGVAMRAYWSEPWAGRHYFPATGRQPRIGRLENVSARSLVRPAESYHRFWSTSSDVLPEGPSGRVQDFDGEPPLEAPLK